MLFDVHKRKCIIWDMTGRTEKVNECITKDRINGKQIDWEMKDWDVRKWKCYIFINIFLYWIRIAVGMHGTSMNKKCHFVWNSITLMDDLQLHFILFYVNLIAVMWIPCQQFTLRVNLCFNSNAVFFLNPLFFLFISLKNRNLTQRP